MSSTNDRLAELQAQTKELEALASAEAAVGKAKAAYQKTQSEKNKAAHREAAKALSDLREQHRAGRSALVDTEQKG